MIYDTIVIGAGAAGLMTAITAKRAGVPHVLLLDSKEKIGAKILMSGGTRCNITNETITLDDYETEQKNIVNSVLKFFPSDKAIAFFNELGVEVVREEGGKFFPTTHSGATVLEALLREIEKLEIELRPSRKVTAVKFENDLFTVTAGEETYQAKTAVLTTGGLSYPTSGSDGSGYDLATSFGHRLVPTSPSLTPLNSSDKDFQKLSGIAMPVKLSLWVGGKKQIEYEDDFLFTHFGFSGPVVLDISRHWIRRQPEGAVLVANFLPMITEEHFLERFRKQSETRPGRQIMTFLTEFLAMRFVETALWKAGLFSDTIFDHLKKEQRQALQNVLYRCPLKVTDAVGYKKAEVTAGGVDLKEVERRTLESKFQPGLFFAGEILDVDARIGGFNFQWAWSSGTVAGLGAAQTLKGKPA